jgi:hypothetical protein
MSRTRIFGSLVGSLLVLALVSCAGEEDIDRTQANRVPKSLFQGTWYVRSVVTDVPGTVTHSFIGLTGTLEKIRWEIQEDYLIAYRAYEEVPGTDSTGKNNAEPDEYKENPIAVFPIKAHFDIKRDYNAATGEQTNVIVENVTDRPWHEREWIRVDWATSKVAAEAFGGATGETQYNAVYFVQGHEDSDDAMRFVDKDDKPINFEKLSTITDHPGTDWSQQVNYFDMVGKFMLEPEMVTLTYTDGSTSKTPLCYFISYGGSNYQTASCGPSEVKVRTAFLKVGQRNYEPMEYGDREMGKFGFFRTERFTWDRKYGFTEKGRVYLANLHNIWEQAYETDETDAFKLDSDGEKIRIPLEKRIPKPIVYHVNEDFPCELVEVAQQIGQSYNVAYRKAVAVAKGLLTKTAGEPEKELASLPTTPEEAKAKGLPDYQYVPKQMFKVDTNGWVQNQEGDDWTCDNLTFDKTKQVARLGDLRYSFIAWINDRQMAGPLGYGPSSADPETGEIIAGMGHIYGSAMDEYAGRALEIVRMLNGDLDVSDVVSGDYVRQYIEKNRLVIDPARIPAEAAQVRGAKIKELFLTDKMQAKLDAMKLGGMEKATGPLQRRIELIKGTALEDYLIDDEIIKGVAPHVLQGVPVGPNDTLSQQLREALSPLSWASTDAIAMDRLRRDRAEKRGIRLRDFEDDSVAGLALELWKKYGKTKDYDSMWQEIRKVIFRGLTEHEIGHTVGLRHNFAGSYDSVNYHNPYWDLRAKSDSKGNGGLVVRDPMKTTEALSFADMYKQAMITEDQVKGRMREYQYSSIMDYFSKFNSDIHGLGKWDEAALVFGHTGYVEVFDNASKEAKIVMRQRYSDCSPRYESIPNLAYSPVLEQWHYSSIWNLLGKKDGMTTRRFRKWSEIKKEQDDATQACKDYIKQGKGTVLEYNQQHDGARDLEVPYMFCSDEYVGATVSCQRWDEGADPMEMADYVINSYNNYYFFNNYKRDRFGFSAYGVYSKIAARYFVYLPNIYYTWLFRVGFYGLDDTTLENYWTVGTWKGFNLLMDVIRAPEYGTFCRYDPSTGACTPSGAQWGRVSSSTDKPTESNRVVVPRGEGRRRYSMYDYDSGYYYNYQVIEAGSFWEYLAALDMLTNSTGTFVGVEMASDFTRYIVPYLILFEDELTKQFEGIVTEDYEAYAPRICDDGKMVVRPAATIGLTSGDELDPTTGEVVEDNGSTCPVINLENWFTNKFYTLVYGMAEFRSLYSLRFADRQMVYRKGSGEDVTPGPGMIEVVCQDPIGGHIYGAIEDASLPADQQGGAVKLLKRCQQQVQQYLNLTPGTTNWYNARSRLNDTIEWANFMRSLYKYYGTNY